MAGLSDLYRRMVPTNVRTFGESLLGNKAPITEKDFSEEELRAMMELIQAKEAQDAQREAWLRGSIRGQEQYQNLPNQRHGQMVPYEQYLKEKQDKIGTFDKTRGKTSVTYQDYPSESSPDSMGWLDTAKASYNDPKFGVATTLGQFNAQDTGDAYQIQDQYNWNPSKGMSLEDLVELFKRPEAIGNTLMRLGPGVNRPVNIKLQK